MEYFVKLGMSVVYKQSYPDTDAKGNWDRVTEEQYRAILEVIKLPKK